jgi:alanine racemase
MPHMASSLAICAADLRSAIRPTLAEVALATLGRNASRIRALTGPTVAVYNVAKADAYGHGAVGLAVSQVEEGQP